MDTEAQAFWVREPGAGEIRPVPLPRPGPGEVLVRTLRSGVSRGTESLVFRGGVPASQYAVMRAPFQEGDFPGPVKYGYLNVGVVEEGPAALRGRTVFCLYPHQTAVRRPGRRARPSCPTTCPPARAVLAGTVETAVNALWDARPAGRRPGRPSSAPAWSAAASPGCSPRIPGVEVTLVDVDPSRAAVAAALGVGLRRPGRRRRRPRPGRAHQRDVRGAAAVARPARAGGRRCSS